MIGRPGTKTPVVVRLDASIYDWTTDSDCKGSRLAHFAAGFPREPTTARPYSDNWLAHMRGGRYRDRLDSGELVVCADLFIRLAKAVGDRTDDPTPITEKYSRVPWSSPALCEQYLAEHAEATARDV